jgi:hypothetical protein
MDAAKQRNFAAASGFCWRTFDSFRELSMSPIAIGTAVGAAALTVGRGALAAVGKGASFAAELVAPTGASNGAAEQKSQCNADRAALKQRADELSQQIERQLTSAGIHLSEPVELISDGSGGIAVATDHPQAAAIKAALSTDILLERDFTMLAGDYEEFVQSTAATDMPPTLVVTVPKSS